MVRADRLVVVVPPAVVCLAAVCLLVAACGEPASSPTPAADHCSSIDAARQVDIDASRRATDQPLTAGEAHFVAIDLDAEQAIHATVEHHGVDVALALLDPSGRKRLTVDTLTGEADPERLPWIAESPGRHHLLVCAPASGADAGRYNVAVSEPTAATDADRDAVTAALAFSAGEELRRQSGPPHEMAENYRTALTLWRNLDDQRQLDALYRLGQLYDKTFGEPQTALAYFESARELFGPASTADVEAGILHAIGRCQFQLGEIDSARQAFEQALERRQVAGLVSREAGTANELGLTLQVLGELPAALTAFDRAIDGWRQSGNRRQQAISLHNRGLAYLDLGDTAQALTDLDQALSVRRQLDDIVAQASTLNAIGMVHERREDTAIALDFHRQALELVRAAGDLHGTAVSLNNLGVVHVEEKRPQEALESFRQALEIYEETGDTYNQAISRSNIGWLLRSTEAERSLAAYRQAMPVFEEFQDVPRLTNTLLGMAVAERRRGRLDAARTLIERSLESIERVRTGTSSRHLRSSLFSTKQDHFDFYIDLLMELHRRQPEAGLDAEALAVSERARARSQLDAMLDSGADAWPGLGENERRALQEMRREIRWRRSRQLHLEEQGTEIERATAAATLSELLRRYDLLRTELRGRGLTRADPIDPPLLNARQIQESVVTADTLLLEFNLGEERSYVWVVGADSIDSYELSGRAQIEESAQLAYRLLGVSRGRKWRGQTERTLDTLSDLLLAPIAEHLDGRHLLIVAEEALSFVPFAALPIPQAAGGGTDPAEPLGARHQVVTIPSASTLAVLRRNREQRQPAPGRLAIIADPVFASDDPRVQNRPRAQDEPRVTDSPSAESVTTASRPARDRGTLFPRLAGTQREAEAIADLAGQDEAVLIASGFEADRHLVSSGSLRGYRWLHFATHAEVDLDRPDMSRLVFSAFDEQGSEQDGFLYAQEIYELDLPADLVVLSACRTAIGQEIRGEGLTGLTQSFFEAGAAAVVVSLWNVEDRVTAELMTHFYRGLLQDGLSPAAALQAAQAAIREQPSWKAPFYWAGFVLQGDGLSTSG